MTQPEAMKTKAYVYGVEKLNGYDAWALFEACAAGDVQRAKSLLAKDRRLANAQFWYQFPIHMAVREGHAEIVKLLLDHGADPGQSRFLGNTWDKLLLVAQERGYLDIESLLLRAMKQKFNYEPEFEQLKQAIMARDSSRVETVLRGRPEFVTATDALGNNALHLSVATRQLKLIQRFAELGTPIDNQRADGKTPLLMALNWYGQMHLPQSIRNRWVIVGDLLARGAEYTISIAAAVGDQQRVEELLQTDTGLAKRLDSARVSPLSYAAREGHSHIVRLLLEHGADPNMPEELAPDGLALYWACCGNHLETAKLLLDHGANPNAGLDSCECCLTIGKVYHGDKAKSLQKLVRQYGAFTPPYKMSVRQMKQAIRDGHEVVRHEEFLGNLLRNRNAKLLDLYLDSDPTVPQRLHHWDGVTYPRSTKLIRKLLARGLDPNRPDWLGKTFLHACAENGDRAIAAILLDAGADINARDLEFKGTPLAAAVRTESYCVEEKLMLRLRQMIEFLLKRGAATNLPDDEPWATPLAWATKHGQRELVELLRAHGAK